MLHPSHSCSDCVRNLLRNIIYRYAAILPYLGLDRVEGADGGLDGVLVVEVGEGGRGGRRRRQRKFLWHRLARLGRSLRRSVLI